jgi:hypothetical protein
MEKLNPDKKNLKNFGITMCVVFLVITGLIIVKHRHSAVPTAVISGTFLFLALIQPLLLKPVYIPWMKLVFVLGWINTRLILSIIFYLVFTPIGLTLKLFGVDLLDRKIDKNRQSYWQKREKKEFNPLDYERQF